MPDTMAWRHMMLVKRRHAETIEAYVTRVACEFDMVCAVLNSFQACLKEGMEPRDAAEAALSDWGILDFNDCQAFYSPLTISHPAAI